MLTYYILDCCWRKMPWNCKKNLGSFDAESYILLLRMGLSYFCTCIKFEA